MTEMALRSSAPAPGVVRIEVSGEVDLATAPRLRDALFDALGTPPDMVPEELLVDLAGVTFLDSTGIGALIAGRNRAVRVGVRFSVRNPVRMVRKVLEIAGLLDVLGVSS